MYKNNNNVCKCTNWITGMLFVTKSLRYITRLCGHAILMKILKSVNIDVTDECKIS